MEIKIGTRASNLAVAQALEVKRYLLEADNSLNENQISIVKIKTSGDKILDQNLAEIGGKGLFTKEIEEALGDNRIDIAVHSMKDMPAIIPQDFKFQAILPRCKSNDALLSNKYHNIDQLPKGATIGTSSSRRKAILLNLRPDLNIVNFRGNVNTRIRKLQDGQVDATILAYAGLQRVGLEDKISQIIDHKIMLPAVAQGAIGVEVRRGDKNIINLVKKINHQPSEICIKAERAFLENLGGDCTTPMAANCNIIDGKLDLKTLIIAKDGSKQFFYHINGDQCDAVKIGKLAAQKSLENSDGILELQ